MKLTDEDVEELNDSFGDDWKVPEGYPDEMPTPVETDAWYLHVAKVASTKSKDPRTKVGAVVVVGTTAVLGYNGFPRGIKDLYHRWIRPHKYAYVEHAERNALHNANFNVKGGTIYITHSPPCRECAKAIIQRGITRVVLGPEYIKSSNDPHGLAMLREAGVEIVEVTEVPYDASRNPAK